MILHIKTNKIKGRGNLIFVSGCWMKRGWDIIDSYLSLMLSCLDGLNAVGKTFEDEKFGGQISLSSAARLSQNLLSIVLLQIKDPTNPEVSNDES